MAPVSLIMKENILTMASNVHHHLANILSYPLSLASFYSHADTVPEIEDKHELGILHQLFPQAKMILPLISNIIHSLASFRYLLKYYLLCEIYLDALFKIRMHPSISHLLFYSSSSFPQHYLLTNYKIYLFIMSFCLLYAPLENPEA